MVDVKMSADFLQKNAREAQKFFLENYWQRKPLLIRAAFPGGLHAVDADTLAGLACQEGVESRIIMEKGRNHAWETEHGPFEETRFADLPKTHWTLLVQAVDRIVPELSQLRDRFRFLPNWRLDDIMISYAVDQGSVGPHTDNYDVFLIQAEGKRRWQYSNEPLDVIEFVEGLDLKILKDFRPDQDFVLEEGDMLYLPPKVAHHGVAVGECLTYSVGFRAPSQTEMLISYAQFLNANEIEGEFFTDDPALHDQRLGSGPGVLQASDKERLRALLHKAIDDNKVFDRWIGAFLTEPRQFHDPSDDELGGEEFEELLAEEERLEKVEGGRFLYFIEGGKVFFSVEGETLVLPPNLSDLARVLSEENAWTTEDLRKHMDKPGASDVLLHLWNQGFLVLP